MYSHHSYDIVPGASQVVDRPDVLIVEGLNVLQAGEGDRLFVSDLFDFSMYVDADERHVEDWYVERFLTLRSTAFQDPGSYFHRWSSLGDDEAKGDRTPRSGATSMGGTWSENIAPTKERARLILEKGGRPLGRRCEVAPTLSRQRAADSTLLSCATHAQTSGARRPARSIGLHRALLRRLGGG